MSEYTVKIISARDIACCVEMPEAIAAMKQAFLAVSTGEAVMPLRTSMLIEEHGGSALFMPAYLSRLSRVSLKTVMTYKNNPARGLPAIHGLVQLYDGETGKPLSILDGEHLTALRTGAASGVATDQMAAPDAQQAAIIGAGVQGRCQLESICAVRDIKRAYVLDRSSQAMEDFAKEMGKRLSLDVQPAGIDVLPEVDIICTATPSRQPLFRHEMLKPGVHINAIGAYRPDMCEIPPETVQGARVFVDQYEACRNEAGDLIQPLAAGLISEDHIRQELGTLLMGDGKNNNHLHREITLFKSVGLAVQDLVIASLIYEKATTMQIGTDVTL
ncbi:ornithine cyclodeaminase family protein [Desulfopila aestuarii]|uniref:Ornithine cyclodeaminase n=1 Tax=Desulfopila aestuarii DSM 18488 TaxID=1121416 RepID=A0A1M7YIF9_9BACT|nr:hypothetical protein [Desulfopila aestuarii]SHO52427.1 ornithine cyclodeaminase [Desulfopila aestuarii DSM 18488]